MIVIYEDDILNLVIVSYHKLFKDIPECQLHKFTINTTAKSLAEIISSARKIHPNETVVLIYSGSVFLNVTGDNVRIVAKSCPEHLLEEGLFENWHNYWAGSVSTLDEEVTRYIFDYYHKIPGLMVRRVVEALKTATDASSLRNLLYAHSCDSLQFQGRQAIEKVQNLIRQDNDFSLQRSIEGIDCTILLSNFVESAFQLIDRGFNNILLCKINLNQKEVVVSIISSKPSNILSGYVVHERGVYKTARIPLKTFIEFIC